MMNEWMIATDVITVVCSVGVGSVMALVCAFGLLVTMGKKNVAVRDEGYDNADISHAPYVLV